MIAGKILAMNEIINSAGAIVHDWANIWQVTAYLSVAVLLVFPIFFREPPRKAEP